MGKSSIRQVIELSGLPEEGVEQFLGEAFGDRGLSLESANLEDLREVLADLLQDLILQTEGH